MKAGAVSTFAFLTLIASAAHAQSAVWAPVEYPGSVQAVSSGAAATLAVGSVAAVARAKGAPVYLPTDNRDPRAGVLAGVLTGGTLAGPGSTAVVKMTTLGGKPSNGATVWLASAYDDDGDGFSLLPPSLGKCTATKPDLTMPAYPFRQQNLVVCGTVVDNSTYDSAKTVKITVASGGVQYVDNSGNPTNTPDTTQTFGGVRLPTGSSFTTGSAAQMQVANNQTLIVTLVVDNVLNLTPVVGTGWRYWNESTSRGWRLDGFEGEQNIQFGSIESGGTIHSAFIGAAGLAPGKNIIVMTRHDSAYHFTINGQNMVTVTDAGADGNSGQTFTIDYAYGVTTALVKLNRSMADAEAQAVAAGATGTTGTSFNGGNYFEEGLDPYKPDPTMVADSAMQWYTDLTTYSGGTLAATAGTGTPFNWTTNGTPVARSWVVTWLHSPATYFQDSDSVATYDSRHSTWTTPFSRIRYRVANQWEFQTSTYFNAGDFDNNDEAAGTEFVASSTIKSTPVAADFTGWNPDYLAWRNFVRKFNTSDSSRWTQLGAGPYNVDLVVGDQINHGGTFASGDYYNRLGLVASVTETPGTTRATSIIETDFSTPQRLVVVADGISMGGHSADLLGESPIAGAPCSRMRAAYPGKITCEVYASMDLYFASQWDGSGSMTTYARRLVDLSRQGSPSRRTIVINLGMLDWHAGIAQITAASTGTLLAALVDAIHAADSTVPVVFAPPIQTTAYSSTNTTGETLQSYVDAEHAVLTGRAWLHQVDFTAPNAITWTDTLHPDFAGQQAVANNAKAALGY